MKKTKIAISILLLLIIAFITVYSVKALYILLISIDATVAAALITGAVTIFISVISVLISKHSEQETTIRNEHRQKKIPIYEELIEFVFKIMKAVREKKPVDDSEVIEFMTKFIQKLLIWGADEVVSSFYEFMQASRNSERGDSITIILALEDVLLKIRKDLGHDNKNIGKGKLLGLFINDIQEYMKEIEKN